MSNPRSHTSKAGEKLKKSLLALLLLPLLAPSISEVITKARKPYDDEKRKQVFTEKCNRKLIACTYEEKSPDQKISYLIIPIDELEYRIPSDLILGSREIIPEPLTYARTLHLTWPNLTGVRSSNTNKDSLTNNKIMVSIRKNNEIPNSIEVSKLESIVRARHGKPMVLNSIPTLQEYPSKNSFPHYRPIDNGVRLADGMPAYFHCGGGALSLGYNIDHADPIPNCKIELTWPQGIEVDIMFSRKHLAQWRKIHDQVITLLTSFEVNGRRPIGTLAIDQ